ncbi:site-specific integrase [Rhizosphaericola mali]|uniref:Tyrosine-type recombinase/integrase n=1 Tax=Rhizosphaericola mali TaxID=2545455 RepID=A0A5P2G4L6_9BACT|nr:site-specific integrase [Rhizosphaericola mali]QES88033.1 tyrosine-type recombinase/integrase [Rhizosphaericola mali]
MKQSIPTVSIVPDKRREKENESFPLKLRITYKGERKYYSTGHNASLDEWERLQTKNVRGKLKTLSNTLSEICVQAQKCCEGLPVFSFAAFEAAFFPKAVSNMSVQTAFDNYMKELRKNGQIGTAVSYNSDCVSLHRFKAGLKFRHLTVDFLKNYESWFLSQGNSITTVSIYVRALRAVMRIEDGIMDVKDYPFGKRKYVVPVGRNIKKALTLEEIARIYNYQAEEGSMDEMSRDYWIFIYLCNGLNMKDMCLLKYKDVEGNFIVYQRAKTMGTRRSHPEPITIALKADARRIIKKWGQKPIQPESYIFPCIEPGMSLEDQRLKIQLLIHLVNEHMKKIAGELGIGKPVTTYYARHSFATILKNSGVSTEFISEALGHSSLKTTKNYLAGFESDAIQKTTDVLLSFKENRLPK